MRCCQTDATYIACLICHVVTDITSETCDFHERFDVRYASADALERYKYKEVLTYRRISNLKVR